MAADGTSFERLLLAEPLEQNLQRELEDSRITCGRDLSNRVVGNAVVGLTEINIVKQVKKLSPELETGVFRHPSIFGQAEIRVEKSRTSQDVSACVAKCPNRVRDEKRRVEVLLD